MVSKKMITMKSSSLLNWEHFNSRHFETEKNISKRQGSYQGLNADAMYTSLEDLEALFSHKLISGRFIDLGCGHGRSALFYADLFPERESIGIEFEKARLDVGESFSIKNKLFNARLYHLDLLTCDIPDGETYFLYFPTGPVLDRILSVLYQKTSAFILIAIESHGDLLPRLDLENWLHAVSEVPLKSARHASCARIYQRHLVTRDDSLLPFTLSFRRHFLFIKDLQDVWIGESFGMEWVTDDRFELQTPPRTINWKNVKKMMVWDDLHALYQLAVDLRARGEVSITSSMGDYEGFIRKIIIEPVFRLELSTGQQVEWNKIFTITQESSLCYESSSDS
jgi:SAM-dependent methyltransferase